MNDQMIFGIFGSIITILLVIIGFFLKATFQEMKDILEQHGKDINELKTGHAVQDQKIEAMNPQKMAELIWVKLKAMQ